MRAKLGLFGEEEEDEALAARNPAICPSWSGCWPRRRRLTITMRTMRMIPRCRRNRIVRTGRIAGLEEEA
jgi:hypothetical protein